MLKDVTGANGEKHILLQMSKVNLMEKVLHYGKMLLQDVF